MLQGLVKQRVNLHVNGFYLWLACTLCAVLATSSLVHRLIQTGELYSLRAMDAGQRVVYHLAAGEVDGTPRHTKHEAEVKSANTEKAAAADEPFVGREGLAAAPLDSIVEQAEKGMLPVAGRDGTLAWKYYGRPYTPPKVARPMVAILVTNLGLSRPLTEEVLKLPHTMTLSFSPYASDSKNWAKKARGEGFESLIDLPMEPVDFPISDPGRYGLLSTLEPAEMVVRLHWALSRYPGYVGAMATLNEKLTSNLTVMRAVLTELTARGVLFVYKKTPANVELASLIKTQNIIALGADAVIDEDLNPAMIRAQLNALEELARKQGYAIGIAHSYPSTARVLSIWNEDLQGKDIDIVPVSAIAKKIFP